MVYIAQITPDLTGLRVAYTPGRMQPELVGVSCRGAIKSGAVTVNPPGSGLAGPLMGPAG
jgi:hypothetical protein